MTTAAEYFYGTGKRKNAIARVRIYPKGSGAIVVNGKPLEEALPWMEWQERAIQPFKVTQETQGRFNVIAKIEGGGISAWADALRHGISRALILADPSTKRDLKKAGLLTRDSRIKESKKYGLKRARRAPHYTKR